MNKIGENQCKDILDSFGWDSTGYEESPGIRAREREDSHIFYNRDWFNIVTPRGMAATRHIYTIYQRGFGAKLTKFDEVGLVSLCAFSRHGFEATPWNEKPQYLAKFFNINKYTREQREKFLLNFILSTGHWSNSQIKAFLDIYFDMEGSSSKGREQFLAKCYECNEIKNQFLYKESESEIKSIIKEHLAKRKESEQDPSSEEYDFIK